MEHSIESTTLPSPPSLHSQTLIEFVNTRRADGDDIGTSQALEEWLCVRGLLPQGTAVGAGAHERALVVREGLRAMLALNNRAGADGHRAASRKPDGLDPAALPALARLAGGIPLVLDVTSRPPRLVPGESGTPEAALAWLFVIVAEAAANGTWPRIKTCREQSCRWAYYDQSRNRSRAWCSMAACGNRAKVRTFRRRVRPGIPAGR
jgi:predicted RNA-binding Zn ribbon-like protein